MFYNPHLYIILHAFLVTHVATKRRNEEQRLFDALFEKNHDTDGRPVLHSSSAVRVQFGVEFMQLISVNERHQYITTKLWVRQLWTSEMLRWNPADYGGIDNLHVHASHIWKPDVVLYNNADDTYNGGTEKYRTLINIHANGTHKWLAPATFTSTCSMNVKFFPFDSQVCKLQFGSWAFDVTKLRLEMDSNDLVSEKYVVSSEWDIIGLRKQNNTVKYICCPDPFQDVTFTFTFKRRPLYFVFNVIAPCVVLMIMILFSFFLPPESGERISLSITVLLAFAVFLQVISTSLPKNADSTPILSIFYMTVMAESALSLMTTCIVLCIHHKGSEKGCQPLPMWVRKCFLDIIPKEIGFRDARLQKQFLGSYREINSDVIDVIKIINKNCDGGGMKGSEEGINQLRKFMSKNEPKLQYMNDNIVQSLNDILHEVSKINMALQEHEKHTDIEDDWKLLGKVIDRLFFYLFLFTFLVSACSILIPVYFRTHP